MTRGTVSARRICSPVSESHDPFRLLGKGPGSVRALFEIKNPVALMPPGFLSVVGTEP